MVQLRDAGSLNVVLKWEIRLVEVSGGDGTSKAHFVDPNLGHV